MDTGARRAGFSAALLMGLLLAISIGIALLSGMVFGPTVGFVRLGLALLAFFGLQYGIFRLFGLRSAADEPDQPDEPDDPDWRAWRG
jgi:hypothetical protein